MMSFSMVRMSASISSSGRGVVVEVAVEVSLVANDADFPVFLVHVRRISPVGSAVFGIEAGFRGAYAGLINCTPRHFMFYSSFFAKEYHLRILRIGEGAAILYV
jgi:hypothetical protein